MASDALNMLAIILTVGSVISGFAAIGSREWWDFGNGWTEYIKGNSRAWLYILVSSSTILSVYHAYLMVDWARMNSNDLLGESLAKARLALHCLVATIFICLHYWTRLHRKASVGHPDRYLWGNGHGIP